jgi:fructose-1,6-bisphosphatase
MTRAQAIRYALRRGYSADQRKRIRQLFDDRVRRANPNEWLKVIFYPAEVIENLSYNHNPFLDLIPIS